ncbi:MAG: hypothetical protein LBH44_01360 [Treponema sp.]|jgi:uncharacterized protein YPO0396|nr:hypothetical protein [Treponema sp.]
MKMQEQEGLLFPKEQFRMYRFQVYNWGTFSGRHDIPISEQGFLIVGRSGTGKTTLLDGFSTLLVPPRWIDYNAAARDGTNRGNDRSLVSYIRGAWAEQKDGDSGDFVVSNLRKATTWSALSLSYRNNLGQIVTLAQLFWVRGSANNNADVKHHYFVFERAFDLREVEGFGQSDFDIRKIKQLFPDAYSCDDFSSYRERFCRKFGIENETALRLLHKTQSAKNLGDLNAFLRDFMLDKPRTFEAAETLVNEFAELNAAHQSVVTARQQIETLAPSREKHKQMELMKVDMALFHELQAGIDSYRETRQIELLNERIASLTVKSEGLEGEAEQKQALLNNYKNVLHELESLHGKIGGDRIEQLENEKLEKEGQRAERGRKLEQAKSACRELGWALESEQGLPTPQGFAGLVGRAREEIEGLDSKNTAIRDEQLSLIGKKKEAESAFTIARREVEALERQPSNIPADMLDMRGKIASALGISEAALPFAGELIEVKQDESSWQGAIERVLRGFALSILVDERSYSALSNYINGTHLGKRLVYYRTGHTESGNERQANSQTGFTDSLVFKLNVKDCNSADWLKAELRNRFNYSCVESVNAFKKQDRALTREGQVKHSKTRHEKDDRFNVNDKRNWVLGFNNKEKLALFKQQAHEQALIISDCDKMLNTLTDQQAKSMSRAMHCQTLSDISWREIDVAPLLDRISAIDEIIGKMREENKELAQIKKQIDEQSSLVSRAEKELVSIKASYENTLTRINDDKNKLSKIENEITIIELTSHQKTGLDERFAQAALTQPFAGNINLDNLDSVAISVIQALGKDTEKINRGINDCEKHIEASFADFKRIWPSEAGDVDTTISSAEDYFAKLTRLETDGLPAHERRFFDLLRNQSNQNLAALNTHLNNEIKAISDKMVDVNDGLRQVPFNKTESVDTYLRINVNDRQLSEVRDFRQVIKETLSHAWNEDRPDAAEARFVSLKSLVERLSSQENEQKHWRDLVLDVRQHVEFVGHEIDESGVDVEVYRGGAGKSGGQRQKLTTTCLAAALRYQLAGNNLGVPMYAAVILDEAFDRADNEFTALAMNIFNNFGFQMIVATPLKSVMTLEQFIGGACFVDIRDRNVSSVLNIEYDNENRRLDLPSHSNEDADIEVSQ